MTNPSDKAIMLNCGDRDLEIAIEDYAFEWHDLHMNPKSGEVDQRALAEDIGSFMEIYEDEQGWQVAREVFEIVERTINELKAN